jgi:Arc/MetJ family transcription regulator
MWWNRVDTRNGNPGLMKTTVDIPDDELLDLMRFTGASTKREAIVTAIADYNCRRRMAALAAHARKAAMLVTPDELQAQRRTS